jgi:NAD(P)-dependent dehydrogenase (short-subunit alcohol dehydrogenase family)
MKTILLTGANSGIGKALAFLAAKDRHRLILLIRKERDVKLLTEQIEAETNHLNIEVLACDLSVQKEIKKICEIINQKYSSIDILVNNAAVYTETRTETVDKIEINLAVNVLAPFLLTKTLLPLLAKANHPRVYNISSIGEKYGKADFDDVMSKKNYSGNTAYNKSKLLMTMLTYKFAELYADKDITFNCIHPGATMTNLVKEKDILKMPFFLRFVFNIVKQFRQKPENAAQKIYELIMDGNKTNATGQFFSNGKLATSSAQAKDKQLINKTWDLCLQLTTS